jgi:hypothetical protein
MINLRKNLFCLGIFLAIPNLSLGEYLAVREMNSTDSSLAWSLFNTDDLSLTLVTDSFGSALDVPIFGSFVEVGIDHIGVVAKNSAGSNLWRLIDSAGNLIAEKELGASTGKVIAGADFDNNGVIDPLVVERQGQGLRWRTALNLFVSEEVNITLKAHGKLSNFNQAFVANLYGDGDWLGIVRPLSNGIHYQVRLKNIVSAEVRNINVLKNGAPSERIIGVTDSEGVDVLAFVRKMSSDKVRARFFNALGEQTNTYVFPVIGEILKGDFDELDPGQELGVHDGGTLYTYNPFSSITNSFSISVETLVGRLSIGQVRDSINCGCEMLAENDGAKVGFVYKHRSDTYGGIVAVVPNPWGLEAIGMSTLDYQCNKIRDLYDNGFGNPDSTGVRHHFKEQSPLYDGKWYRNNYGSIYLQIVGTNKCLFLEDPAQPRID